VSGGEKKCRDETSGCGEGAGSLEGRWLEERREELSN